MLLLYLPINLSENQAYFKVARSVTMNIFRKKKIFSF